MLCTSSGTPQAISAGPLVSLACRHRRTDRSLTRSSAAITAASTRCSNLFTASSRTCSRRLLRPESYGWPALPRWRAYNSHTDRIIHSERAAKSQHDFALFEVYRIAERQGPEPGRFDLQQREVKQAVSIGRILKPYRFG